MPPRKSLDSLEIIQWLDRKRWESHSWSAWDSWSRGLPPEEAVLTHWLTYVTDRQMSASKVWDVGAPVFRAWVKKYRRQRSFDPSKYYSRKEGFEGDDVPFKSRYPSKDFEAIKKTLTVLCSFDKSIIRYVGDILEKFQHDEDTVSRIACALYLLTYDVNRSSRQILRVLGERESFDHYYRKWLRHKASGKKRLWAAFRDYIKDGSKYRTSFLAGLKRADYPPALIKLYGRFGKELQYLNQLELPGDVWNNHQIFVRNYLRPLGHTLGVRISDADIENWRVNEKVRQICDEAQKQNYDIYPEQFDVTFDFVPTMCANPDNSSAVLCREICPFGTGNPFFLKYHSDSKFCLTALMLTQTFSPCNEQEHKIFTNGVGRMTCHGYKRKHL